MEVVNADVKCRMGIIMHGHKKEGESLHPLNILLFKKEFVAL
jgi:hypothetical protein